MSSSPSAPPAGAETSAKGVATTPDITFPITSCNVDDCSELSDEIRHSLRTQGKDTVWPIQAAIYECMAQSDAEAITINCPDACGKNTAIKVVVIKHCADRRQKEPLMVQYYAFGGHPRVIVVVPTRTRAKSFRTGLLRMVKNAKGATTDVKVGACIERAPTKLTYPAFEGSPELREAVFPNDVVVCTPGRLCNMLALNRISLKHTSLVVFEEAHTLFDPYGREKFSFMQQIAEKVRAQALAIKEDPKKSLRSVFIMTGVTNSAMHGAMNKVLTDITLPNTTLSAPSAITTTRCFMRISDLREGILELRKDHGSEDTTVDRLDCLLELICGLGMMEGFKDANGRLGPLLIVTGTRSEAYRVYWAICNTSTHDQRNGVYYISRDVPCKHSEYYLQAFKQGRGDIGILIATEDQITNGSSFPNNPTIIRFSGSHVNSTEERLLPTFHSVMSRIGHLGQDGTIITLIDTETPKDRALLYCIMQEREDRGEQETFEVEPWMETEFAAMKEAGGPLSSSSAITCRKCNEPGHKASKCTTNAKPKPYNSKCKNCHEHGHHASSCTNDKVDFCKTCDTTGHLASKCPEQKCYSCGNKGHLRSDCTACKNCKKMGHDSQACPEQKCYRCGERGHQTQGCKKCSECREEGHRAAHCPNIPCKNCGATDHQFTKCPSPLVNEVIIANTRCVWCEEKGHPTHVCPDFQAAMSAYNKAKAEDKARHRTQGAGNGGDGDGDGKRGRAKGNETFTA